MITNANRTILVTGGARGIGAATARLLASRGYQVAINFRADPSEVDPLVAEIRDAGGQAQAFQADVADESQVVGLFSEVQAQLGIVWGLVNNAGTLGRQMELVDMSQARMEEVFRVNVIGSMLCAREAVRVMSTKRGGQGGAIVNVSSAASRLGAPHEYVDYAASKGAVDSFTLGLAKEVAAHGIRVNAVRPGFIDTPIHARGGEPNRLQRVVSSIPMQRWGQPIEVAEAIAWLLGEESSFVTGALLDVAGGR